MTKPNSAARRARWLLFASLLSTVAAVAACSTGSGGGSPGPTVTVTHDASGSGSTAAPSSSSASPTQPPASPVHVTAFPGDGSVVGIGMPIIATFNKKITDAKQFAAHTKVTVNGQPANGAWFFEFSDPKSGHVMEAHYRPQSYWPGHARIHVSFDLKGVSAGTGLAFDGRLTSLDFSTGAANLVTVDDRSHTLSVTTDGKFWGRFPVSLGSLAAHTPTARGVKVIMEKLTSVCMSGNPPNAPAYHECGVKWDQRLTYGGEYLHAAPWNCVGYTGCTGPANNIGSADSSNGCTNLRPLDAEKLYSHLQVGDPVNFPNANGPKMQMGDGYGDWNVPWALWQTGGAVPTH